MARSPLFDLATGEADRQRVEDALRASVQTDDAYLTEVASHLIVAGGKRLRPMISVVAAQVGGGAGTDDAVQGGVSCELVHLGSLYHDDVMDEADTRRGVDTVNARWGNLQAILAGDFLLAKASEIAASLGTEVAALLARTIGRLCQGEITQLRHTYDIARTEDSYLASIEGKTAALFATAARVGGIVGGLDRPTIDTLTEYGRAYGMVFQIVDDLLDLTSNEAKLGKPAGHDMVEGVYTLPVLRTLAAGGASAGELADLLGKPLTGVEREKALAIVRSNAGLGEAREVAASYVAAAAACCNALPDSPATAALAAAPAALLDSLT